MPHVQFRSVLVKGWVWWLGWLLPLAASGGGSGFNVVVVANQSSSNSCEVANYFCEQRGVPPEHVLFINWAGTNTLWGSSDFQSVLLNPLTNMVAYAGLSNQIDYVVLSMDIPFQTLNQGTINSTTAGLFYGLKTNNGADLGNSYAASESVFHQAQPVTAPGYSFLATMITADSVAQAEQLVDQGTAGDGTFPQAPVILAKSFDPKRNLRYTEFDNAILNINILDVSSILRTNTDLLWVQTNCPGFETGLPNYSLAAGTFTPGAIADSLTSSGGVIFGSGGTGQTSLLACIYAGAGGSYGTVDEPGADTQQFPNSQVYFYQARGFSLAEAYYQSLNVPFRGLIVGEPFAAPYVQKNTGRLQTVNSNTMVSGTTQMSVRFGSIDTSHPLQQVNLFVDGKFFLSLTNVGPRAGNQLTVTLNGYPVTYSVPSNATANVVATGLASLLNAPSNAVATQIAATAYGDRIELQSTSTNPLGTPFYFATSGTSNQSGTSVRTGYVLWPSPPQVSLTGPDHLGTMDVHMNTPDLMPYVVAASTNLTDWVAIATNTAGGSMDLSDTSATTVPQRFFRVIGAAPDPTPKISLPVKGMSAGGFKVHVENNTALTYVVIGSTNLINWAGLYTNALGQSADFLDTQATNSPYKYYRAVIPSNQSGPPIALVTNTSAGGQMYEIYSAARPYSIDMSTDQVSWVSALTNLSPATTQVAVSSTVGTADSVTTFLNAGRSTLLASQAFGRQNFTISATTLSAGAYAYFTFTKTNGAVVTVGVTNQVAGTASSNLAFQLCSNVNSTVALQGGDGVVAEDVVMVNTAGSVNFNLRARSPGLQAALLQVNAKKSGVFLLPSGQMSLTGNLSDLRSRDHLYVTTGATGFGFRFPLDTTQLTDGYHELEAVAYEGSSVQTQSRATLPVYVQNSQLTASLTPTDFSTNAPVAVTGTYHVQVTANTNNVSAISLFTTGGLLNVVSNQSSATFTINGPSLGAGLHPYYALVQTSTGQQYRTETQSVRFVH
jgi:uncharacterized protein (TIGR03790 family)